MPIPNSGCMLVNGFTPGAVYIKSDQVFIKKFSQFHTITCWTLLNHGPMSQGSKKQQWGNWPGEWSPWATKPMLKRSEYTSNTIRILSICSEVRATGCTRTILMANSRSQQTAYFVLGHSFPNRLHVEAVPFQNKSRTWPHVFREVTAVLASSHTPCKRHLSLQEEFMGVSEVIEHLGLKINFQ